MRKEVNLMAKMRRFYEVIEELRLKDLLLSDCQFTWCGGSNSQAMSRLYYFLVSDEWEDHFSSAFQCALPKIVSDHYPITLEGGGVKRGKTVDPHFSRASPLDRRDSLFIISEKIILEKVEIATYFIFILKGK